MQAKLRWLILGSIVIVLTFGSLWIARAKRALDEARSEVSNASIPFEIHPVSDSKPAAMDYLAMPPDFRDGALFNERIYLSGAGGLWSYDLSGKLQSSYLAGRDLPPFTLSALTVGALAGSSEPKLWIAAGPGLLAFDGARFSQIEFTGKSHGNVTSLLMLPTGILLIGFSEGGLLAYNGSTITPFHPNLRNLPVTALAGDEGDLWIGTRDRGVVHWRGGSTEDFHDQNGLPDNGILSLVSSEGRIFAGTSVGVAEFRDGKHVRNLAEGILGRTLLLRQDVLLIGTLDEGVIEVRLSNQNGRSFVSNARGISDFEPRSVRRLLEINGAPYALAADALFEREGSTGLWTRRLALESAAWSDRNVSALSIDPAGKLWVGYFDRGIDIASDGGVQKAVHVEDEQVFCVNRIVWDPHRNVQVVATANGLVLFGRDGKIVRRMAQPDGLISSHVTDVAVRTAGLALATSAGVTILDDAGPQSIYAFHGLANNHVYTLASNGNRLLAGTLGGLSVIQDSLVRASYTTSNSPLKQNWISAVVPAGDDWFVGTYGGGVLRLDAEGKWMEFSDMPAKTVINPNAMIAVSDRILAGTLDGGLLVYSPAQNRWTRYTDGLPSMNITALAASAGKLFVGTDNGIVSMPFERLP